MVLVSQQYGVPEYISKPVNKVFREIFIPTETE